LIVNTGRPFYIIVALLIAILCLCAFGLLNQTSITVEPSPVEPSINVQSAVPDVIVEPSPVEPSINVQSAVPDVIVEPEINVLPNEYEQRYTPELIEIEMRNREFPYAVRNITSEYQDKGLWIVTVQFNSFVVKSKQYIFDETVGG